MDADIISAIFFIAILIMSVVIHEVSHGYVANIFGDPTARLAGRLTLNPVPHIDPLGSFIIPAILFFSTHGSFVFGWAKPVPVNPYNIKKGRLGMGLVSAAGVLANLLVAIIFGLIVRFSEALALSSSFIEIALNIMVINLVLAIFNLIPVPPLDGSKVLFSLLPVRLHYIEEALERYWMFLIIGVLLLAPSIILPILQFMVRLLVGV